MHSPIAYTYEADVHCADCTEVRFGITLTGEDNEGNQVGAIAPWDEWWDVTHNECERLVCSNCHDELDDAHHVGCAEGINPCDLEEV